jgi:hypothetical protein
VLQRNVTDYPAFVGGHSVRVEPGEVIDHPDPITGFEPVPDEPADEPAPEPAPEPAADPEPEPGATTTTAPTEESTP